MRRIPALALAIVVPIALLVAGSASASPVTPVANALSAAHGSQHGAAHGSLEPVGADRAARWAASASADRGGLPKIHGLVATGRVITVEPRTVPAGRYKVIVKDTGERHNWHIYGPGGINKETKVREVGRTVWKLTFVAGTYQVVCDPHVEDMHTTLEVT